MKTIAVKQQELPLDDHNPLTGPYAAGVYYYNRWILPETAEWDETDDFIMEALHDGDFTYDPHMDVVGQVPGRYGLEKLEAKGRV